MTSLFAANELTLLWPLLAFFVFFMLGWGGNMMGQIFPALQFGHIVGLFIEPEKMPFFQNCFYCKFYHCRFMDNLPIDIKKQYM